MFGSDPQADIERGWIMAVLLFSLLSHAGPSVRLELVNEPTGWHYEQAYWSDISLQVD